ncbi:hypothetical protein TNCV_4077121 [Trichonephila clavipes]|nr:hypothetical protein TNCV_4077121 [Trichonephila clavipes]
MTGNVCRKSPDSSMIVHSDILWLPFKSCKVATVSMYITVIRQKVNGTLKIQFHFLIPHSETEHTTDFPMHASSAARAKESSHVGLEREAIFPNSSNIQQCYACL